MSQRKNFLHVVSSLQHWILLLNQDTICRAVKVLKPCIGYTTETQMQIAQSKT